MPSLDPGRTMGSPGFEPGRIMVVSASGRVLRGDGSWRVSLLSQLGSQCLLPTKDPPGRVQRLPKCPSDQSAPLFQSSSQGSWTGPLPGFGSKGPSALHVGTLLGGGHSCSFCMQGRVATSDRGGVQDGVETLAGMQSGHCGPWSVSSIDQHREKKKSQSFCPRWCSPLSFTPTPLKLSPHAPRTSWVHVSQAAGWVSHRSSCACSQREVQHREK